MRKFTLCMLACCSVAASLYAQDVPVNREKYPDYVDPQKAYPAEPRLLKFVPVEGESQSRKAAMAKAASELPEYWNNADTKYFPPVFNQDGGSCGSASRISYMFTHEINALRDVSGKLPENQYPSHFVWLLTNGNSGKDAFVEYVGVPNSVHYGGRTYSSFFGYQEETNNDFGWMTGYDRWMNAIGNRMLRPTSNPLTVDTEAGRLAAKAWLYNHAGDLDFKTGGLIGLGVASGGQWHNIPSTPANDAAGVTGKYFVHRWGTQVDHAVTMVGWDDRIEFDLDGNGVAGEVDKDEKGAWIIVNSWGNWCNAGFIYCPYKYAGPVSDPETGAMRNGYWSGELYHARKNFRPLRAIKLKMDYSHRSELLLQVGISSDVNATEPEAVMDMHHFRYAGDGANGDANPVPATPMLGNWKGKMNHAPMEFCYDLTDLSANFDTNKPLKYFFIINRKKDTSVGSGNIHAASIVDMESDVNGIETPFDLGGDKFEVTTKGKRLMISTVVYGMGYQPVTNLVLTEGTLTWDAPIRSSFNVASYNIYKDGVLLDNTKERTYTVNGGMEYAVTAVYEDGKESAKATCTASVPQNKKAVSFNNSGFTIPNVFSNKYQECTIDLLIKPAQFLNYNCAAGPGWGTYMHHFNSNGTFTCGWDTQNRLTTSSAFTKNAWNHLVIVVKGNVMTVYKDGTRMSSVTSSSYSGLGGFGDLVFRSDNGNNSWQHAQYDEIRIWDYARTPEQIKGSASSTRKVEFFGDVMPQGLIAYYKGDTFVGEDGKCYMRDYVGGNHATIQSAEDPMIDITANWGKPSLDPSVGVNVPQEVNAGVPVTLTAQYGEAINKLAWTVASCDIADMCTKSLTVTFKEAGQHTVAIKGTAYDGQEYVSEVTVDVKDTPALDASFSVSTSRLPAGEHLSMWANNFVDGCSYEWHMPGAETEVAYGMKCGATYQEHGEYEIVLKMTSADGTTAETSQRVRVTAIAPEADFRVSESVVMKGTPITLTSTSKYAPTSYEWTIAGDARNTTIVDASAEEQWTPEHPGKYNITLEATNIMGSSSVTKERALTVVNDDSKNGLSFSKPESKVSVPNSANLLAFTLEFWANPSTLSEYCLGMGDKAENLLIKVNAQGAMIVTINGRNFTSKAGFVKAGEWNHYAIRRAINGYLYLYRNCELFDSRTTAVNKDAIKDMSTFTIGVDGIPMNGSIDEFRLWNSDYSLSNLKKTSNQALEKPESYVGGTKKLLVYYDFNQSGGDVIDRSGNGNNGVRTGFGPDGDAWGLSKGVFSLYLGEKLADETITAIDEVWTDESITAGRTGVYTLSGQYVGKTIEGLPAGMYIVNGKKMFVK